MAEIRAVVRSSPGRGIATLSWREVIGWETEDCFWATEDGETEDLSENPVPIYGPPLVELEVPIEEFYRHERPLTEWVESRLPRPEEPSGE